MALYPRCGQQSGWDVSRGVVEVLRKADSKFPDRSEVVA
jgi:hypothetical protein